MEKSRPSKASRTGTPGLDVFKIAGRSISGFLPSLKTGDQHRIRMPYTTTLELKLALYLEYHPHVLSYQRGDMSTAFANARRIFTSLGTPYRVGYTYEEKPHDYLPDFVGTLWDGGLLIAEAGRESEKSKGQALAKAEAARRLVEIKGGSYWLGTDHNLSELRSYNLLYLHARRQPFSTYEEIAATLLAYWPWGEERSVREMIQRFGSHWSEVEVEAAFWKLVGDAAARGHFLVDLTEGELSRSTPIAFLDRDAPPILPDPLPSSLETTEVVDEVSPDASDEGNDAAIELSALIPGPTFDPSSLATKEAQAHFHRNLAAVTDVLTGGTLPQVAQAHKMTISVLGRLVQRTKELGQIACAPYATYHRECTLHPEFQKLIRKLYTHPLHPTVMAVYEDPRLKRLAEELSEREGKLVRAPTYRQVWYFLDKISQLDFVQNY